MPLAGCAGYQVGTRSLYAPDVTTVYVPMIESESYRRDLGERLTEAVIKEIELKTPYKVVGTPDADSILSAHLLGDTRHVLVENAFDNPRVSENELRAEVTWLNRRRLPIVPVQTLAVPPELVSITQTSNRDPRGGPVGRLVAAAGHRAARPTDRLHDGSAVVSSVLLTLRVRNSLSRSERSTLISRLVRRTRLSVLRACDNLGAWFTASSTNDFPAARRSGSFARARSNCRAGRW